MAHLDTLVRAAQIQKTLSFSEAVRARQSCRGFLPTPVPDETIHAALEDAQFTPSNCNTQPWHTHVFSGASRDALSTTFLKAFDAGEDTKDFSFDVMAFEGCYQDRRFEFGSLVYQSFGIDRDNAEGRKAFSRMNYSFFGAPHVALLFMPSVGDNVRVAGDIGMYGQTFMLALASRGIASIPQTSLGSMAATAREFLGLPDELKLLFGVSFGYADPDARGAGRAPMFRLPLEESVTYYR